jgi:hypothetical protein
MRSLWPPFEVTALVSLAGVEGYLLPTCYRIPTLDADVKGV